MAFDDDGNTDTCMVKILKEIQDNGFQDIEELNRYLENPSNVVGRSSLQDIKHRYYEKSTRKMAKLVYIDAKTDKIDIKIVDQTSPPIDVNNKKSTTTNKNNKVHSSDFARIASDHYPNYSNIMSAMNDQMDAQR